MPLTRDHVVWAYRLFLDREPEGEEAILQKLHEHGSTDSLRREFLCAAEFRNRNSDIGHVARSAVVLKELPSGLRIFVDLSDATIGKSIVEETYELRELELARERLRPGDVALDLGANVGLFTLVMAERVGPEGHVHAFEPFPRIAELLRRSIAENDFEGRVTLHRAAAGRASGSAELVAPERSWHWGGAYLNAAGREVPPGHVTTSIEICRIDDLALRRPVRLIKIDIEGAEPLALSGARDLLRRDRPMILCELNPHQLRTVSQTTVEGFLGQLSELGYGARALDGRDYDPRRLLDGEFQSENVLFEPA